MPIPVSKLGGDGTLTVGGTLAQYVQDLNVPLGGNEVDDTTRANAGFTSTRVGLRNWGISFTMVSKEGDAMFTTLQTAWQTAAILETVLATDAVGHALGGSVSVPTFNKSEPINGVVTVDVVLKGYGAPTTVS